MSLRHHRSSWYERRSSQSLAGVRQQQCVGLSSLSVVGGWRSLSVWTSLGAVGSVAAAAVVQITVRPFDQWRRFLLNSGGRHGERVERELITGSGGRAPSGVQGQSPWSGGQGGGRSPPEAERKLSFDNTTTRLILH